MADIAASADVAEGTIYKLFANKRELLYTVMEDWYHAFTHGLEQHLRGIDDPSRQLRYLIWRHLRIIKDDPALCRVFFREIRAYDDYRGSAMFKLNQDYTAHTLNVLRDGVNAGLFRRDIPLSIMRDTIFGGLEHYAWQYLAGQKDLDVDTTTDQFWRLIVSGITTGRERAPSAIDRLGPLVDRLEAVAARMEQES